MSNILTLHPYQINTTWVFDDEHTQLKEEAFVLGMSEIISEVINHKNIPNANTGFTMEFSDEYFEGYDAMVTKEYAESGGTWYSGNIFGKEMRGWLCPALFLYFKEAPLHIYMKASVLPEGISPIWDVSEQEFRQFISHEDY
jgi:hypothetical protein